MRLPHELGHLLTPRNRRRYEPFGVAVDKRYAFSMGARPVIYMPSAEAAAILDEDEMWRVVSIDMTRNPPIDWTFEREWRAARRSAAYARSSRWLWWRAGAMSMKSTNASMASLRARA